MSTQPDAPTSLRDYLDVLRRRRWVVLGALFLVPFAAVLLSQLQEAQYEASSQVLLKRQSLAAAITGGQDPNQYQDPELLGRTQAKIAAVPALAGRVLKAAHLTDRTPAELLAATKVAPIPRTDVVLKFSVTDRLPQVATILASEYAKQYAIYRRGLDTEAYDAARQQLGVRLDKLRASGVDASSTLYQDLLEKQQTLATLATLQGSNVSVLQSPDAAAKVWPKTALNGVLGLMIGMVLGVGLAFLLEALDRRVRSDQDLTTLLELPLLGRVPVLQGPTDPRELAMLYRRDTAEAEAYRRLRASLELADPGLDARTIMVTSATRGEGKSTTIANLAVAMARAGRRVALVDLDIHKPTVGAFFGIRGRAGVSQVVAGRVSLTDALVRVDLSAAQDPAATRARGASTPTGTLDVLASSSSPANPGEFVASTNVAGMLQELSGMVDIVLVDAPPLLLVSDAVVLSRYVGAVIVVVRISMADQVTLSELSRELDSFPCAKLGYVLTGVETYAGYGYGYQVSEPVALDQSRNERRGLRQVDPGESATQASGTRSRWVSE
jgi:Mrp family chromosome partitioning ATPase/capsular polysaccharide biosynthesis protein